MLPVLVRLETRLRSTPLPQLASRLGVRVGDDREGPPRVGDVPLSSREANDVEATELLLTRWPVRARCLRKALLVGHALAHRDPVLRIGVARHDGEVHAHAWIEVDGLVPERTERDVEFLPLRRARRR
jgi:hypothetical protein